MSSETFRYSWIRVTDEDARAESMRCAMDVQQSLMERAYAAPPASPEARNVDELLLMARTYLGEELEAAVRVVIYPPGNDATLHLVALDAQPLCRAGIEIAMATMPAGYTRAEAEAWLDTEVGAAWSKGALACRLVCAVAVAEDDHPITVHGHAGRQEAACKTTF